MTETVSCVMVTQASREAMARASIDCFLQQTYPSRELVLISDDGDSLGRLERYAAERGAAVKASYGGAEMTLGALRNVGSTLATGELICQWDDDDLYHPERISRQVAVMGPQHAASFLTDQLHLFSVNQAVFWTNWQRGAPGIKALIPGTVIYRRDKLLLYPAEGEQASKGEDTVLRAQLVRDHQVAALSGDGWIYLRRYHGDNTWNYAHHYFNAKTRGLPLQALTPRLAEIDAALQYYRVDLRWLCGVARQRVTRYPRS
jgi:glycosyltransferase involved in cell wall biosynthesis